MFDLFRFIMLRPPESVNDGDGIALAEDTALHQQLKTALAGPEPLDKVRTVASDFVQGEQFVSAISNLALGDGLEAFDVSLQANPQANLAKIKSLARTAF